MTMDQSMEWFARDTEVLGGKLPQCRFVHHKSLDDLIRARTPAAALESQRLTVWALLRPLGARLVETFFTSYGIRRVIAKFIRLFLLPLLHHHPTRAFAHSDLMANIWINVKVSTLFELKWKSTNVRAFPNPPPSVFQCVVTCVHCKERSHSGKYSIPTFVNAVETSCWHTCFSFTHSTLFFFLLPFTPERRQQRIHFSHHGFRCIAIKQSAIFFSGLVLLECSSYN
jgi:hypothetical protein